jgi:hypothetical protein
MLKTEGNKMRYNTHSKAAYQQGLIGAMPTFVPHSPGMRPCVYEVQK